MISAEVLLQLPSLTLACAILLCAGEGIHTAMMGGKAAAETIIDMHATGDFTRQSCKQYARRWYKAYGHDFFMSQLMAETVYK